MNTNVVTNPRFGKLECVVGVLTTLVLVGICAALTTDLHSFVAAGLPWAFGPPKILQVESPGPRQGDRVANRSGTIKANPAVQQPRALDKSIETQAEAQEPPARVAGDAPPSPHRDSIPHSPWHDFIGATILAVAMLFALAIVAALVFVHCFFALLRRHSRRFGPLIRIEYAGAPPMVVGPFTASSFDALGAVQEAGLERRNKFGEAQAGSVGAQAAKQFDLGPTFESQRHLKEEQGKRQEEAVLQHLFEDNLKLHSQIGLAKEQKQGAAKEPNG
jgi:hypothetical protein